jgi:type I restriction enzyme S subunit
MNVIDDREHGSAGQQQACPEPARGEPAESVERGAAMKKGWQTKTLGDICEMYQPKTISGKDMVEDGAYPVYGANGVIGRYNQFNHEEPQLLITCRGATCGSVNISAPRSWVTGNAMVVRPKNESLEMRYLEYLFLGGIDISKAITGAAQPQITRTNLEPLEISYPESPAEQQRIVALLDEAFAGLATAKANTERNLRSARAIFESHLQHVFSQRGEGWVEKSLKEVCEKITDGTHQTPKYFSEGIVFLSSRNVTSGKIDWGNVKYIDNAQHLEMHRRVAPRRGDILLAKNGTTGVAAIVDRDTVFDIYVSLAHIRPLPVIRPQLLLHFINSPVAKVQFNQRLKGVGVPNLHLEEIREVRLHFPEDLMAQDRLVAEVDKLLAETQRLTRIYERKLAALEELKKSLLHQAFNGEL